MAIEDDDSVREVRSHDEIVLDDESSLLGVHNEALDDAGRDDTLLGVEIGAWLVNEVDVGWHTESEYDGDTLQFTPGKVLHFLVNEVIELEGFVDVCLKLRVQERGLDLLEEELADCACELRGDLLRLHGDVHWWYGVSAVRFFGAS